MYIKLEKSWYRETESWGVMSPANKRFQIKYKYPQIVL